MLTRLCEHCGGAGCFRVEFFVREHYQDFSDYVGPFAMLAEAEACLAERERKYGKGQDHTSYIVEKLVRVSANMPSPGALRR